MTPPEIPLRTSTACGGRSTSCSATSGRARACPRTGARSAPASTSTTPATRPRPWSRRTSPGFALDDVSLEIRGRVLVISGERKARDTEGRVYQQIEIEHGPFQREIQLGVDVVADQARATYEDGILRVELPVAGAAGGAARCRSRRATKKARRSREDRGRREPETRSTRSPRTRACPDALPVLPLKETVAFPNTVTPLAVGQERSVQLVNDALGRDRMLVMVASRDSEIEQPGPDDVYRVGVAGTIARMLKMPDGTLRILVQGGQRVRHRRVRLRGALPGGAHPRGAGHRGAVVRARGAHAPHPDHLLEHHRGRSLSARGAADRGRQRRRPGGARPHDRGLPAHQASRRSRSCSRRPTSRSGCAGSPRSSRASWR